MQPLDGRSCGDCSLCCKLMAIEELNKPDGVWCDHFVRGTGCGIYPSRPTACRDFLCQWLLNPRMGPEWKPNKCGMVVTTEKPSKLIVHVDKDSPGPFREPYLTWLRRMAAFALEERGMVLVIHKGRTTLMLPDRGVDLGVVADEDKIVVAEFGTGPFRRWEASVKKTTP